MGSCVHVLCEALEVPRGTFYNHLYRNKRGATAAAKRREELRVQIREIFDESRQIFGAGKIRAVLMDRGHQVSQKLVAELDAGDGYLQPAQQREAGLQALARL